jgi:glycerol-3-phosphate dehydrogenase
MSLWISHKRVNEAATKVAEIMAKEYRWNDEKKMQEIKNYIDYVKKTVSFI